jgi:hypothetical protein
MCLCISQCGVAWCVGNTKIPERNSALPWKHSVPDRGMFGNAGCRADGADRESVEALRFDHLKLDTDPPDQVIDRRGEQAVFGPWSLR